LPGAGDQRVGPEARSATWAHPAQFARSIPDLPDPSRGQPDMQGVQ
jgi:hypothetical protein